MNRRRIRIVRAPWVVGAHLGFILLMVAGCATVPFESAPRTAPGAASPDEVRAAFSRTQKPSYEALQSVVFQVFGRKMTGLGYLSIDTSADAFALACMTPMGMKLFEVQGRGDEVEALFALPQFGEKTDLAQAVGEDLRRAYFDNLPGDDADVRRRRHRLTYTQRRAAGRTEYDFGGPRQLLLEKRFYRGRKRVARVRYFDYREHEGYLFPHGLVVDNRAYHYRLILRLKSLPGNNRH